MSRLFTTSFKQNFGLLLPLLIWLTVSFLESAWLIFGDKKIFYFRAWESAICLNNCQAPFRKNFRYSGLVRGDLLNMAGILPSRDSFRWQEFITDESGYRNRPERDGRKFEVVIMGTSEVAGAAVSQEETLSEILANKYRISAYNYGLGGFLKEDRWIQNQPRYLIVVGTDNELIRPDYINLDPYSGLLSAGYRQEPKIWEAAKNLSYFRYLTNKVYLGANQAVVNLFSTDRLQGDGKIFIDKRSGFIFDSPQKEDPTLGKKFSLGEIAAAVKRMQIARAALASRGINLMVAVVPGRNGLEWEGFHDVEVQNTAENYFTGELKRVGIRTVDLSPKLFPLVHGGNFHAYFPDDSHWVPAVNGLLADEIASLIR